MASLMQPGLTPSRDELFESLLRDEISMETLEEISDVKAWLATLHTRQLMGMRYGGWVANGYGNGLTDAQMHAMVKAELATREHVPNKIEARRIRQERAKRRGVNRGSRR